MRVVLGIALVVWLGSLACLGASVARCTTILSYLTKGKDEALFQCFNMTR
jgi:hypothetical protein